MNKLFFEELNELGLVIAFYTQKGCGSWHYEDADALQNYEALGKELGIQASSMVRTKQTHTACVKAVDASNGGEGVCKPFGAMGFDGMVTNTKGLLLCTLEADCVPVYLVDPIAKAIGMVHSGWRGTAGQISVQGIKLLQERYGSKPENIIVAVGPHICADCYEVSADLYAPFAERYTSKEMEQIFVPEPGKADKYLLNLQEAIKCSVLKAGVLEKNFVKAHYCTYHDNLFDSYRLNGGQRARMLTGIMLK